MKKNQIVKQTGYKECGACCLLSIIRYYKGNVSLHKLLELTETNKNGTNFYNLEKAAKEIGLSSKSYQVEKINTLKEIKLPFICQIINNNYEHFVVVYKIYKNKVELMDPATGKKNITIDELSKIYTGYIMIFSPEKKLPIYINKKYLNHLIIETLNNNKSLILNILCLSIIFTILSCIYAFYNQLIIDRITTININNLMLVTLLFGIVIIIKTLASLLRNISLIYINQKLDCNMFLKTFNKILLLPYNYYKNRTTGEVISRINDLSYIKNLISKIILTVFLDFLVSLVCSLILIKINKSMFQLLIIIIIAYIVLYIIFRPIIKKLTHIQQENNAQINSKLVEYISGFESIKNLNNESKINLDMEKNYISCLNDSCTYSYVNCYKMFFQDILYLTGLLLVSYIGYKNVIISKMSIGEVITFISITPFFIEPIKNLTDLGYESFYSINAIKRINELFEINCEDLEKETTLNIEGKIEIKNLSYTYNNNDIILKNINLNINKGEKILLLGQSGSGKSTLLKLLYKYLNIKRGVIKINGYDINDYTLKDIRKNITYISQDETIFTDTIKNNIKQLRKIDDEKFYDICKDTYVENIVNDLFLGYDTNLEENGLNISGGQKQRIILARALLKDSKIILIDEGLNAIDVQLEKNILRNIFEKYKDKTFIIVSHRTNNMELYDKVYKIDKGILINA